MIEEVGESGRNASVVFGGANHKRILFFDLLIQFTQIFRRLGWVCEGSVVVFGGLEDLLLQGQPG